LPYNADVIGAMAFVYRRQGQWKPALADFAQAARLDPRNPSWRNEAGTTLMALRRYAEAAREFAQALAIAPDDYDAKTRRIWVALLSGETARAKRELASITPDGDPQGYVSALRFELAWLMRKPDAALAVLDKAQTWKPHRPLRADAWLFKATRLEPATTTKQPARR
ncbi:MAG: tetratricopeptide repeat protein, partial [Gammaproteobacteria bacterium]